MKFSVSFPFTLKSKNQQAKLNTAYLAAKATSSRISLKRSFSWAQLTRKILPLGVLTLVGALSLSSCVTPTNETGIPGYHPHNFKIASDNMITDYSNGGNNINQLVKLLHSGKYSNYFNVVQLGDSHTAADAMSGWTRQTLQARYGVGSVGFIEPLSVEGQNNTQVTYRKTNVNLINARNTKNYSYFFGGYIANFNEGGEVDYHSNNITDHSPGYLIARCLNQDTCSLLLGGANQDLQEVSVDGSFKLIPVTLSKDFSLISQTNATEVAGLMQVNQHPGLSYTAIGSNGATLNYLDAWPSDWPQSLAVLQPNLVILSYGTNESFGNVNVAAYKAKYSQLIRKIRSANPQATILIVSNPDSLNKIYPNLRNVYCGGLQHPGVMTIHKALQEIAQENHTLFWDWQQAMGGQCSMVDAVQSGVARPDGVHFGVPTYKEFGKKLANDLMNDAGWHKG